MNLVYVSLLSGCLFRYKYIYFFSSFKFIVILFSDSNNFEDVPVIPAPGAPAVAPLFLR